MQDVATVLAQTMSVWASACLLLAVVDGVRGAGARPVIRWVLTGVVFVVLALLAYPVDELGVDARRVGIVVGVLTLPVALWMHTCAWALVTSQAGSGRH